MFSGMTFMVDDKMCISVGPDRIMFASDYPYVIVPDGGSRRFLEGAEISERDREKIASGNWERLCEDIRR